jgi:hypothetical protein
MPNAQPVPDYTKFGFVAHQYGKKLLPLQVCKSAAGYFIGTLDEGSPFSRESDGYYPSEAAAGAALTTLAWEQKPAP